MRFTTSLKNRFLTVISCRAHRSFNFVSLLRELMCLLVSCKLKRIWDEKELKEELKRRSKQKHLLPACGDHRRVEGRYENFLSRSIINSLIRMTKFVKENTRRSSTNRR